MTGTVGKQPLICSVCVATYRRPELLHKLLRSLVAQLLPDSVIMEIIVVDNDSEGSAEQIVHHYHDTERMTFHYFRQPKKNISLTRNMAVANATGTYVLFIDDDEEASSEWVAKLLWALREYDADGVFGPTFPVFDDTAPEWIKKGAKVFADTVPKTGTGTKTRGMWGGNCMIKTALLWTVKGPFNPEYGTTGGEDTELFAKLQQNGAHFIYCNEAPAFEYWPPERTQVSYLMKRSLKGTNSYTRLIIASSKRKMIVRFYKLIKSLVFGFISLVFMILLFFNKIQRTFWQIKLASNVGRFLAVIGYHYQAYR